MKNSKFTFLLLFSFLISSCGFHLRGSQDLSAFLPEVQIQGTSKHSELGRELTQALTSAKINVLDESETLLNISKDGFSKRILSLDSAGRANQYELSYQLSFSLVKELKVDNAETKIKQNIVDLMPLQTITEKREYLFDANLILAKSDEEARLNNDMRQAAILQLVRRLNFSLKKSSLKLNHKDSK